MNDLVDAIEKVLNFLDLCDGGESYMTMPNGERLTTDWGYVYDGLTMLLDYAKEVTK